MRSNPESATTEGGAPPPEEAAPPEAQKEPPLPPENSQPDQEKPAPEPANETSQFAEPSKPKEQEEIHVVYHHPPDYGYRYEYGHYQQLGDGGELPQPVHVTHSYNKYKPSPYVTEHMYLHSPPGYIHYSRPDQYNQVYYNGNNNNGNGNGNITSMFSEENPNACSIV